MPASGKMSKHFRMRFISLFVLLNLLSVIHSQTNASLTVGDERREFLGENVCETLTSGTITDNLSCANIQARETGNSDDCLMRSQLCDGVIQCLPSGEDEAVGTTLNNLVCDFQDPASSLFLCDFGENPISIDLICDGVADCGGEISLDEVSVICDNKCRLPYYGGCDLTRECLSSRFVRTCGECLPGYVDVGTDTCARVSTTPDTQNTATVFFERIFDETFVPGVSEVCISSSGIAPDETIIVDLTFTLSNLFIEALMLIPPALNFTSTNQTQCFNVVLSSGAVGLLNSQTVGTIEITLSPSPESMGLVEITRNTTTIAVLPGVNQGEIRVLFPEAVNVSGGNLIVVCFSLDFGDILLQEQAIEIVLTLDVEDNNTSPNDYQRDAIPFSLRLNNFTSTRCLQVPSFQNETEQEPPSESFIIRVLSAATEPLGSFLVTPSSSSIVVTLFEQCVDGDVRLAEGNDPMQGRVQMCFDGVFGTVCDTTVWTGQDATVVCTQLGYPILLPGIEFHQPLAIFGPVAGPVIPGNFTCQTALEPTLLNCSQEDTLPAVCTPNAGVQCFGNRLEGCEDGELRLVGSNVTTSGRVEICYRNEWGTVCDDSWDDSDAVVVCAQLGLFSDSPAVALSNSPFGDGGVGPIWLDEVNCTGQEATLTECASNPFGVHNCVHFNDAGVDCGPPLVVIDPTTGPSTESTTEAITTETVRTPVTEATVGVVDVTTLAMATATGEETTEELIFGDTTEAPITQQPTAPLPSQECEAEETFLDQSVILPWPTTAPGETHTLSCPFTEFGFVTRRCSFEGVWEEPERENCDRGPCRPDQLTCESEEGRCYSASNTCDGIPDCVFEESIIGGDELLPQCFPNDTCTLGELRPLVGGASTREGLLEICVDGSRYFPVTLDGFTFLEAGVVCRQLNLGSAGFPISALSDLEIPSTLFSLLPGLSVVSVACNASAQNLSQCELFVDPDVNLNAVAGVRCIDAFDCTDGEMRLVSASGEITGATDGEVRNGRLEICYQGVWGAVYDPDWSAIDAAVTCQQLGFDPRGALPQVSAVFSPDVLPVVYDCPVCDTLNTTLLECPRRFGIANGQLGELTIQLGSLDLLNVLSGIVGVLCEVFPDDGCNALDVRLSFRERGGATGNLEVCTIDNQWMPLCGDFFDQEELDVVCRSLGFGEFEDSVLNNFFSNPGTLVNASGVILDFICDGAENELADCLINSRKRRSTCEVPNPRITCLSRPEILFEPPIPSGTVFIDEGRSATISCSVDNRFSEPPLAILASNNSFAIGQASLPNPPPDNPPPMIPGKKKREAVPSEERLSVIVFETASATLEDSGVYNCTAYSGGMFNGFTVDNELLFGDGTVVTTRSIEIVVQGTPDVGSVQYLRFSAVSSVRLGVVFGQLSQITIIDTVEDMVVNSINQDIPGQQRVTCRTVPRRELDLNRGLDRYECVIVQSEPLEPDSIDLVEAAAAVFERTSPLVVGVTINTSLAGFCDAEGTEFVPPSDLPPELVEPVTLFWPETEAGILVTVLCPGSDNIATRECISGGVWLEPNTSACVIDELCGPGQFPCLTEGERCIEDAYVCDGIPDCIVSFFPFTAFDEQQCLDSVCSDGDVLPLVGGSMEGEGFVQVCLGGRYLPLATVTTTVLEANVICRQLGLGTAGFPIDFFADLGSAAEVLERSATLDRSTIQVNCTGSEQSLSLSDCTILDSDNPFSSFVAIKCIDAVDCTDGEMRLVSASGETEGVRNGRLEICYQGVWGAVADTDWSAIDAAVTCQELGFDERGALPFLSAVFPSDPRLLPIVYDSPSCDSVFEQSLLDCPRVSDPESPVVFGRLGFLLEDFVGSFALTDVVGVSCEDYPTENCTEFDVRLSYRDQGNATGNLEICYQNMWHSVCSERVNRFGTAVVTCRALGFSVFEDTEIPIELSPVEVDERLLDFPGLISCAGSEQNLSECDFLGGIKRGATLCSQQSGLRIQCPSPPEILLIPPVLSGVYEVDEGAGRAGLTCLVDNQFSHPDVIRIDTDPTNLDDQVPRLGKRKKRSAMDTRSKRIAIIDESAELQVFFGDLYFPLEAREEDSGVYTCTAVSANRFPDGSGQEFDRGSDQEFNSSVLRVNITVIAPTPGVNEVAQYLRFSVVSFERRSQFNFLFRSDGENFEETLEFGPEDEVLLPSLEDFNETLRLLEIDIFNSINEFIAGQQRVTCQIVSRRLFDEQRGFDRFECVIFTTGVSGDAEVSTLSPVEAAAQVFQRGFSEEIIGVSTSDVGFCDSEQTMFEGASLDWPETEVGEVATAPCPSSAGTITRVCESVGVWLDPNILECVGCTSEQFVCESEGGRCVDERFRCDGVPDCIGEEFPFVAFDEEAEQCSTRECADGDALELVGGATAREGFVEVCVDGAFLPVSLTNFSVAEAGVLCRQLNLGSAGFPFTIGDLNVQSGVLFDGFESQAFVFCEGNEQSLSECQLSSDQNSFGNLVAVRCIDAVDCTDGEMRLVSASGETEGVRNGRLEICYQGVWGAVYDTDWSAIDAAVTCQQLGFDQRGALPFISAVFETDPDLFPVVYDFPVCVSVNGSLLDCQRFFLQDIGEAGRLGRLLFEDDAAVGVNALLGIVGVVCEDYTDGNCTEFDVRLTYRERNNATGNIEVCRNNGWQSASACLGNFGTQEVAVACRALGFDDFDRTLLTPSIIPPVETITGPVFNGNLPCDGNERDLTVCAGNAKRRKRLICEDNPTANTRVECLARPVIMVDPPVPSGVLRVSAGRVAELQCIVDNTHTNPAVDMLVSDGRVDFTANRPSLLLPDGPATSLFTVVSPTVEDSGVYTCTASSRIISGREEIISFETTRSVQVIIEDFNDSDNVAQEFLRLSVVNFERIDEVNAASGDQLTLAEIETSIEFLVTTSITGNTQRSVDCQIVGSREFDIERGFDRYECVIRSSAASVADSSQPEEQLSAAEGAVAVLQRSVENLFLSFSISALGFCDFEETVFEGTTLPWPETAAGEAVTVSCRSGNATRQCSIEGVWQDPDTDFCGGLATDINVLTSNLTAVSLDEQVEVFAVAVSSSQTNPAEQTSEVLVAVASYFNRVASLVGEIVNDGSDNTTISVQVVTGLVASLSSLQQWETPVISESDDSSRIIMYFEFVAFQFAEQALTTFNTTEEGLAFVAENLQVDFLVNNGRSITFGSITDFFLDDALEEGFILPPGALASVSLPPQLFSTIFDRDLVGVFFALYEEPTLFPPREAEGVTESTLRQAVASSVVAANVGPGLDFSNLEPPVEINLRLTTNFTGFFVRNGSETCVSWDFTAAGGEGNWTTEGCVTTAVSDDGVVTCECNHLTNFAILVDICTRFEDCQISAAVETLLSVISIVGSVLSMIGLIITFVTLLVFKKLRDRDNSKYHIQLSIAIFCMLLVFITGIEQTAVYGGCVVVSLLIHYFSLAAVMWMGAEAALMFHKLVFVFKKVTKSKIVITSIVCWVAPLVPVLIPMIIDLTTGPGPENDLIIRRFRQDRSNQFCFLSNPIVFWVAFLGPIFAVIIFNVVIYVVVIAILIKHTRGSLSRKNETLNRKTLIRLMISIAGVMFLFGLSWLFGALTITGASGVQITFQILFAIFTSLQGFFVFLFFCVFSKEARELWKEKLSCGRYKSRFLNPNLKFASGGTAGKHRTPRNGTGGVSTSASSPYTSRSTQETVSTFKPTSYASSTENIINSQADSIDESSPVTSHSSPHCEFSELPANNEAGRDFASVAESEDLVAETDIDSDDIVINNSGTSGEYSSSTSEGNVEVEVDLTQPAGQGNVTTEEVQIQFT